MLRNQSKLRHGSNDIPHVHKNTEAVHTFLHKIVQIDEELSDYRGHSHISVGFSGYL